MFGSEATDRLLDVLRGTFQVVLLDTAPVLHVADTRVLAAKVDAVVILAKWRTTPRAAVESALKQLESVGARIAGIELTQVDLREQTRSGYGDGGHYYRLYKQYYDDPNGTGYRER